MNGLTMNYDRYKESLEKMKEPPFPNVIFDMRGLIDYAKGKGVKISLLSDEEKKQFIHPKNS